MLLEFERRSSCLGIAKCNPVSRTCNPLMFRTGDSIALDDLVGSGTSPRVADDGVKPNLSQ